MNQAEAIVTGLIRVAGSMCLLVLIALGSFRADREATSTELAALVNDPEEKIKMMDFAGGTVVHVSWMPIIFIVFLVLIVCAPYIAKQVTPKYKSIEPDR